MIYIKVIIQGESNHEKTKIHIQNRHSLQASVCEAPGASAFSDYTEFHSEFQPLEVTRYIPLTDKFVLHFFELSKLPKEIDRNDLLLLWLSLFKADTVEELDKINGMGVPELSEAVNAYHSVTTSPEYQEYERLMIKASHDEAQALKNAARKAAEAERKKWQKIVEEYERLSKENVLLKKEVLQEEAREEFQAKIDEQAAEIEKQAAENEKQAAENKKQAVEIERLKAMLEAQGG